MTLDLLPEGGIGKMPGQEQSNDKMNLGNLSNLTGFQQFFRPYGNQLNCCYAICKC